MASVLFWNVARRNLAVAVAAIAKDFSVDVIVLAESGSSAAELRRALASEMPDTPFEEPAFQSCGVLSVSIRHSRVFWRPVTESRRFVVAELALPARMPILLAAAHLRSRLHSNEDSLNEDCRYFASRIREAEEEVGMRRTVVVGDLNLNPFDPGVVRASGLHGVMTRELAKRGLRTVNGVEYPFFYNPMWSRLGGASKGPPGSYYYSDSQQLNYFWHTFDQALVRPELLEEFSDRGLSVLTRIRGVDLLKNGRPDRKKFSDHLPLVVSLNLRPEIGGRNGSRESVAGRLV